MNAPRSSSALCQGVKTGDYPPPVKDGGYGSGARDPM
jgi:hypothetical protein